MELEIRLSGYNKKEILKIPKKGRINLSLTNSKIAGLHNYGDLEIFIDGFPSKVIENFDSPFRLSAKNFLKMELLRQGYLAYDDSRDGIVFNASNRYISVMNKLKDIQGEYFRFIEFKDFKKWDNILTVCFKGHEVSGSYVPAKEVVPRYLETIKLKCLREVDFVSYDGRGPLGYAIYTFNIFLDNILKPKQHDLVLIENEKHFLYFLGLERKSAYGSGYEYYSWIDNSNIPEEFKDFHIGFFQTLRNYMDTGTMKNHQNDGGIGRVMYLKDVIEYMKDNNILHFNKKPIKKYLDKLKNYNQCQWNSWILNPNQSWFYPIEELRHRSWYSPDNRLAFEKLKEEFVEKYLPEYIKNTNGFKKDFLTKYKMLF